MVALILSTLFTSFIFIIYGYFFTKILKIQSNFIEKLLLGLVVCNTLASYISLFFPVNIITTSILFSIGLCLILYIKKEIKVHILLMRKNKYAMVSSLCFILIAFVLSIDVPHHYDTGLYHLQYIKWIEEYSVVPGLANLHGRFGFNPNISTFFALTSFKDFFKQEIFSVNFTIFSLFVFYLLKKMYSLFKNQSFSNLFFIFFLFLLIILSLENISSPAPDFSTTVILLFIFARMIDLNFQKVNLKLKIYFPILILCVYLLTIKLSAFPILILFTFIFLKCKSEFRKYIWLLTIICLVIFPWLTRNIITTGWLVYPFPSLDLFSFDWKVPIDQVIKEKDGVTGWARNPGEGYMKALEMGFADWIPIWWKKRMESLHGVIFVLSIIFPILIVIVQLLKKLTVDFFTNAFIVSSFFGVVFWFLMAPDWRFGESFILLAAMSPLLVLKPSIKPKLSPKFLFSLILIFLIGYNEIGKSFIAIAVLSPLLLFKSYLSPKYKTNIIFGVLLFIVLIGYVEINYSKIKTNSYHTLYTSYKVPPNIKIPTNVNFRIYKISDIDIYVPTVGDRCFCHEIPCTPYPKSNIVLRKNTLKSGFKQKNN